MLHHNGLLFQARECGDNSYQVPDISFFVSEIQDLQAEFWMLSLIASSFLFVGLLTLLKNNAWGWLTIVAGVVLLLFSLRIMMRIREASEAITKPTLTDEASILIQRLSTQDFTACEELRYKVDHQQITGGSYLGACRALAHAYEALNRTDEAILMADNVLVKFAGDMSMRKLVERLKPESDPDEEPGSNKGENVEET